MENVNPNCRAIFMGTFLLLVLGACATYTDETREIRNNFVLASYDLALSKLEASSLKTEGKNKLLYHLEKSSIIERMGDRKASRSLLIEADKTADDLYTSSVMKGAATFLVNEGVSDYSGEDYEKVAIHTMLALSFLEDQDYDSARVEAKKINSKLQEITQAYPPEQAHYKEDAFARFLSGLVYESKQNWDDAIIDYQTALNLYEKTYARFVTDGVPPELVSSLYNLAKKRGRNSLVKELQSRYSSLLNSLASQNEEAGGTVVVLHKAGKIAIKEAKEFVIPLGGQIVRFSFPYIRNSSVEPVHRLTGLTVRSSGAFISASNAVNMNAIAYQGLEDRRTRLMLKGAARLLAKGQITYQAEKNFGPLGWLIASIWAVSTETADTRSWTLLPQAFYVNRIQLKPGSHQLELKTSGRTTQLVPVKVEDGSFSIFVSKS
ncbi:MAG: hypothetical protein KA436_04175 [Oligoflexales bacterium]|nr:hypothetical protein [Oligoflexales bacterium]